MTRLLKIRGLKFIYVLFEFKHTEFFTSLGGYLLNTKLKDPIVGFLVADLDCAKFGYYQFPFCLILVVIFCLKVHFHKFKSNAYYWWKFYSVRRRKENTLKTIETIGMASEKLYRNTLNRSIPNKTNIN